MADKLQELAFYLLGLGLTVIPLFYDLYLKHFGTRNNRKPKLYFIIIVLLTICLVFLAVKKIDRDSKKDITSESNIRNLNSSLKRIRNSQIADSVSNKKFLNDLEKKYSIVRDSSTNSPKKVNFNTHIDYAKEVNIGH